MGRHGLHLIQPNAWETHHDLPIHGVRSQGQMHRLTHKLGHFEKLTDRLQHLVYEMKVCPQAFSGDQLIALAPFFLGSELVVALHLFDTHLFGLRCDQAAQLLEKIPEPEQRLSALQVIAKHLLDPVNRFQLRNLFPPYLLPQVDQILSEVRGQSHVYGLVSSSRVIFLIDTSGSMATSFRTNCGQQFNRLEFVVHDLHKILHHRVQPGFKFNIIHFGTDVHRWKHSLTPATSHHLKEAEHYLDELEPEGNTNTYEALKQALSDEEADTIYLLSDGEPSMDMRTILFELKIWLQQRRNPCVIHTIAFLMGHTHNDPKPREFMADIAVMGRGVFRCMDPFTPIHQEFGGNFYNDNPNFSDDEFVQFYEGRLRCVPQQFLQNVGLYPQPFPGNNPYPNQPSYPIPQPYPPSQMSPASAPYQQQPPYPIPQSYPSPPIVPANISYQQQPSNSIQQPYPPPQMSPASAPYQQQPPYPIPQSYPSPPIAPANISYQQQPSNSIQQQYPSPTVAAADNQGNSSNVCILL